LNAEIKQDHRWACGAVFLTALGLHLIFGYIIFPLILQHRSSWSWTAANNDGYDLIASNLLAGHGFSLDGQHPTAQRLPVYPLLLAAHRLIPGIAQHIQQAMTFSHSLLHALTAVFIYLFILRYLGGSRKAGLAGAGLMVLFPDSFYYVPRCLSENLFIFLVVSYIYAQFRSISPGGRPWAVVAGICLGLAMLTRGTLLYLPVFTMLVMALGWLWLPQIRALVMPLGFSFAVAGLLILPWGLRNQALSGHFFVAVTNSGIALYHGTQLTIHMPQILRHPSLFDQRESETYRELEKRAAEAGRAKPELQALPAIERELFFDHIAYQAALRVMQDHYLALLGGYVLNIFSCMFMTNNSLHILISFLFNVPCTILGILGLAEIWQFRIDLRRVLLPVLLVCSYLYFLSLVYPLERYFSPILPLLFPFVPFSLPGRWRSLIGA